jgi:predicted NBD/HSP70 family sugar kinase
VCSSDLSLSLLIDFAFPQPHRPSQSRIFFFFLSGCGGGIAIKGDERPGLNGLAGEWGHSPLPWQTRAEASAGDGGGLACWCGRRNCLETWISGTGFVADYRRTGGGVAPCSAARRRTGNF